MKYLIASSAMRNTNNFFGTYGSEVGNGALVAFWNDVGHQLPEASRVAPRGLHVTRRTQPDSPETICITFPTPVEAGDAYFLVVQRSAGWVGRRVFSLEKADPPVSAVIAELSHRGRYNWGPGPTSLGDFLASVDAIATDESRKPIAFFELNISSFVDGWRLLKAKASHRVNRQDASAQSSRNVSDAP
jgi:hypothetical protein